MPRRTAFRNPGDSTSTRYVPIRIGVNAGSLDPSKVRDALASLDVMTFFGQIKFDSRGINIYKPMVVEQIQNGTHYTVFPPSVANGPPQYPTPSWSSR